MSRSASSSSSSSSLLPANLQSSVPGEEAAAPQFELTAVVHELREPLLHADCQADVMALLGSSGALILRDGRRDGPPLAAAVRNPHRVFVDPSGTHTLTAASDGLVYYYSPHRRRVTGHFTLQQRGFTRDGIMSSFTANNNVAECVYWLPTSESEGTGTRTTTTSEAVIAEDSSHTATATSSSSTTIVRCLIGTKIGGFVFEVSMEVPMESGTVKTVCRQCLQLPTSSFQSPVASIQAERVNSLWVVFISTPNKLYRIEGEADSPTALLDRAAAEPDIIHLREVFSAQDSSARGVFTMYRPGEGMPAQSYAWTSTAGIVHGLFNRSIERGLCKSEAVLFGWNDASTVVNEQLLALTKIKQFESSTTHGTSSSSDNVTTSSRSHSIPREKMPMEVSLTAFHMVLLYNDRLVVLNHPAGLTWRSSSSTLQGDFPYSCEIEEKIRFDPFRGARNTQELIGIIRDVTARKMYIFGKNHVWELHVEQEHRQQWRLFLYRAMNTNESLPLRKRFFYAAYQLCKYNTPCKNLVQILRGKFFLQIGAIRHATDILADCDRFEEVYQLLISLQNNKVLQWYVEKRYKMLLKFALNKQAMVTQLACLLALIVIQRLDRITRSEIGGEKSIEASSSLSEFLEESIIEQPYLFENTAYAELIGRLLKDQGRPELALRYAEKMNKLHYLVTYHVSQGEYTQAADILASHARRVDTLEIWYEFAPILVKKCPIRLMRAMLRAVARDAQGTPYMLLKLERLIPVFIQYTPEMNEEPNNKEHQVIIFLEHCIRKFDCVSTVVHNYYLSLLAQHDVDRLEEFLESSLFYSVDFALRRCLEARRYRQCVGLYRRLHLYEDAIRIALECSAPLHRKSSNSNDEDWPALRMVKDLLKSLTDSVEASKLKKLWRIVAQYVMEKDNTRAALDVVEDSNGVLKLEDVLGDITDSNVLQNFKDAICKSLDAYTSTITVLKEQQVEANQIAEGLKQEISQLQHRFGYITARQCCILCHRGLLQGSAPYLIYPNCRHAVHEACAVLRLEAIGGLEAFFSDGGLPRQFLEGVTCSKDLAQVECVLCGEASILEIDVPLFEEDASWSVE
ncbi:Pep3/Vps18/deep orange [Trypanosoma melophagium]|uniref:Pep3/Vps18/deep orange n=1 Tax=Trypanosoma melophagium TaxID=715481 RepID=UPI00351A484C|nr:Pep3/Vps18/deep orange [Trypanosoma melophagium]